VAITLAWPSDRTCCCSTKPLANLDPLARTEVMGQLMATLAVQYCPGPHRPPRRTTESIDALAYLAATPHTAARNGRRRGPAWRVPPPSRRRWLTIKLAALAVAALLGDAAQSLLLTWTTDQFLVKPSTASPTGRCLISSAWLQPALWLFALILGVAVGLLIRRTLPHDGRDPGAVRRGDARAGRDRAVLRVTGPPRPICGDQSRWARGVRPATRGLGTRLAATRTRRPRRRGQHSPTALPALRPSVRWDESCLAQHNITALEYYQPHGRFWRFQWTEAGVLPGATTLLTGLVLIRVSRHAD